jgi:RNA polymerase sigma-70 factor (ECF subfamily)
MKAFEREVQVMPNKDLDSQIDLLLRAALRKSGNLEDAQDLVQETLLASIAYLSKGKTIKEPRAWLLTVLNRKYYDTLRKKYNYPKVNIGENFDIADDTHAIEEIEKSDEAEAIRREIAYLSKIYREVIVRFYMNGEEVGQIAAALSIPAGTVKSRLSEGRARMKEGLNMRDSYNKQSYEPIELHVANSG